MYKRTVCKLKRQENIAKRVVVSTGFVGAVVASLVAATPAQDPTDSFFGVTVHDPYRWLENASSPSVQSWVTDQNQKAQAVLTALPYRAALAARLQALLSVTTTDVPEHAGRRIFFERREANRDRPVYYVREDGQLTDRVLLDGNALGAHLTFDDLQPSPDGRYVAYLLHPNNSDEAVLHMIDATSGQVLADHIEGADDADTNWASNSKGFYYVKLPTNPQIAATDRVAQATVRWHAVGTDEREDPEIYSATQDSSRFLSPYVSRDGQWLFIYNRCGWQSDTVTVKNLQKPGAPWVTLFSSTSTYANTWEWKGWFYIDTDDGAPRHQIFRVPVTSPDRAHWQRVVAERPDAVLDGMTLCSGHLVLRWQKEAASEIEIRDLNGRHSKTVSLPGLGTVGDVQGHEDEDTVYYEYESFTEAPRVEAYSVLAGTATTWAKTTVPFDSSTCRVERVWYPSKDGTPISMFIVSSRALLRDGSTPFILSGYGGFDTSIEPHFMPFYIPWLEAGGALAFPNLRGGGEYGEAWHEAGMLTRKQNVFDDFAAAATFLATRGYTSHDRLEVEGASNGGLLIAATVTQHPELARVAICKVPLTDMLRYPLVGEGATWIPEYGSPQNEAQFRALYAYSPYHHVSPAFYPATLLLSSANDDRVDPMHVRKFAAALEAANRSNRPILLRTYAHAGHGGAGQRSAQVQEWTDRLSFIMNELGVTYP